MEKAWDVAQGQIPGTDALTDVLVEVGGNVVTLFYNQGCYRISGVPVRFK